MKNIWFLLFLWGRNNRSISLLSLPSETDSKGGKDSPGAPAITAAAARSYKKSPHLIVPILATISSFFFPPFPVVFTTCWLLARLADIYENKEKTPTPPQQKPKTHSSQSLQTNSEPDLKPIEVNGKTPWRGE